MSDRIMQPGGTREPLGRRVACVAWLLFVLSAHVCMAGDWPQWLGPNRDGVSSETEWQAVWPPAGPKVLWKANVGVGHSAVAIRNGLLYTMGNEKDIDTVYCMKADTGAPVWKHSYACERGRWPGPHSTPTLDGERAYTFSRQGHVFCFEASTGKVVWSRNVKAELNAKGPRWDYACSPLVLGEMLIVETGAEAGSIVAFDKSSGRVMWQVGNELPGHSSPVAFQLGGKTYVAVFTAAGLLGIDPDEGKQLWRYPWESNKPNESATPLVADDRIFISSAYGGGCALLKVQARGVTEVWRNHNMSNHFNNCMFWKGYLYGTHGHTGGKPPLRCLDFETGKVMWSKPIRGGAALLLAGGKLIMLTGRGDLVVVDPAPTGYRELSRAKILEKICWTPPVLSHGRIYCRNNNGDLVCLDVRRQ